MLSLSYAHIHRQPPASALAAAATLGGEDETEEEEEEEEGERAAPVEVSEEGRKEGPGWLCLQSPIPMFRPRVPFPAFLLPSLLD